MAAQPRSHSRARAMSNVMRVLFIVRSPGLQLRDYRPVLHTGHNNVKVVCDLTGSLDPLGPPVPASRECATLGSRDTAAEQIPRVLLARSAPTTATAAVVGSP